MHIGDCRAAAVVKQLNMTGVARDRIGSGRSGGLVLRPLPRPGQIGARDVGEARTIANVGADAVHGVEFGLEEFVARLEGSFDGFVILATFDQLEQIQLAGVLGVRFVERADHPQVVNHRAHCDSAQDQRRTRDDEIRRQTGSVRAFHTASRESAS